MFMLEPPVEKGGEGEEPGEPVTFRRPGGTPEEVTGGGSFRTAPALDGAGRYTDTLQPGETVFYRVDLTWGQAMAHEVMAAEGPAARRGGGPPDTAAPDPRPRRSRPRRAARPRVPAPGAATAVLRFPAATTVKTLAGLSDMNGLDDAAAAPRAGRGSGSPFSRAFARNFNTVADGDPYCRKAGGKGDFRTR
ncbi:hypothetical protein [Actinomadura hallensis]|nr:hypothetical protein [Actinomadura hallensis]